MKLCDCNISEFNSRYGNVPKIVFGVSKGLERNGRITQSDLALKNISHVMDNNGKLIGTSLDVFGNNYIVSEPSKQLLDNDSNIILITTLRYESTCQIIDQIREMGLSDDVLVFSALKILEHKTYDNLAMEGSDNVCTGCIPRVIHCFWAGGKKPSNVEMCFDSWKKHCPDYEIVEWNEKNYNLESNKYIRQSCAAKKWAFVSDYVRLDVIYKYGGIYMDFDVEVLKSLDDLLCFDAFMAFESTGLINIGSGMGAKAGHPLIKLLLDQYNDIEFLEKDEQFSSKTIIMQPIRQREVFERYGYQNNGKSQIINNVAFLSPDYINTVADPRHNKIYLRGNEYMVHWTHASWYDEYHQKEREDSNLYRDLLYEMDWRSV